MLFKLLRLGRKFKSVTVDDSDVADSTEIPWASYSMGRFRVPSGSGITLITWYDSEEAGGTYGPSNDENSNAITQSVTAGETYPFPISLAGACVIKPKGDASGTIHIFRKG